MTSKEIVLNTHRNMGEADAKKLREMAAAGEVTDTEVIASEQAVPDWHNNTDYSKAPVGTPVADAGQIYGLIQPHNAAHYPATTPAMLHALWRVKHTTDPKKAKPFVQPTSTSDMYLKGECMLWTDGVVKRALRDTNFSPDQYAADWEDAEV